MTDAGPVSYLPYKQGFENFAFPAAILTETLSYLNANEKEQLALCARNLFQRIMGNHLMIDCSLERPGQFSPELQILDVVKPIYGRTKLQITTRDVKDLTTLMDCAERWIISINGYPPERENVSKRRDRHMAAIYALTNVPFPERVTGSSQRQASSDYERIA